MDPLISIVIHGFGRVHEPGETLRGEVQIDAVDPDDIEALELSVLWHTEGKGDEDLGVHFFQRFTAIGPHRGALHQLRTFQVVLPESPLSYDGVAIRIRWSARVRLFLTKGREHVAEQEFQLGNLPPAEILGTRPESMQTASAHGELAGATR